MSDDTPGKSALAHSAALCDYLHDAIKTAGGRLPFGRYMELALYAPGLGYYSAGSAKFGQAGDFVTAPEVSPLFGQALARGIADTLGELGEDAVLFEFGAGSGALAAQLLDELARLDRLPREYLIMEVSGDLRDRQRRALESLGDDARGRVRWLDKLPERPLRGVIVANEVVDALPFERFRVGADGAADIAWVASHGDGFADVWDRPGPEVAAQIDGLRTALREDAGVELPAGYESEIRPPAAAFVFTLSHCLEAGLILLGDYGGTRRELYLPERDRGTMLCHHRHRASADPYRWPGLQDITAWVDFTQLAEAGVDAGLRVAGYSTQAHFLIGCGLDAVLAAALERSPERAAALHSEAKTLTLPGEMGERFKFMGLTRGLTGPVAALGVRDLTVTL